MGTRVIRGRDLVRRPWKNGGGTTSEVLVEPPDAGLDSFDWRISMADVASAGPFSIFAGIDRTLALIEGAGIELDIDGVTHRLDAASPIVGFPGDVRTCAALPSGPIRDLNVMTRRTRFSHRMAVIRPEADPAGPYGAIVAMVALHDETLVRLDAAAHDLDRLDVLVAEQPPPSTISVSRPAILICLNPR